MEEFLKELQRLKDGCRDVFEEIREKIKLLPEEIAPYTEGDDLYLEPPDPPEGGEAYALRITPRGLFWERRRGINNTTAYIYNSGEANPGLATEILQQWLEYWSRVQEDLAETKSRISLRNRQIRDLRRQLCR